MKKQVNKIQPSMSKIISEYMRSHKWSALFYISFGIFWAFTLPYMSYLFGHIIDQIKLHGTETSTVFQLVAASLTLYVTIHVMRSIGYYAHAIFSLISIPIHKARITKNIFEHLGGQSIDYFEAKHSGALSSKITNVNISYEPILSSIFTTIFPQSLAIIITGILLSTVVPYFGLVLWLWGVIIIIYTYRSAIIGRKKASDFAEACSQYNGRVVDVLTNIQTVIHNASIKSESDKLDADMNNLISKERIRNRHAAKVGLIQHLAMNALVACYLVGSVIAYDRGVVSIGDVVFVMTAVTAIAGLTNSLGNCFLELLYHIGMFKQGMSLLEDSPDVPEFESASPHSIKESTIDIKSISFTYGMQPKIFTDFDLSVPAFQKIGIVGSSGAGKTTLIKLIMRLYDVTSGEICIDGINTKEYTKHSLRSQIAVVPQHLTLFHRSIYDNIAYGCEGADKAAVVDAAKKAHCHEFITTLEHQYDTIIGEQGVKLSGGQRQRIAIARAILKNAPILLLDEATSALDSATEQAIQYALETLLKDKTAIVIAHRLSTLKAMDRIIVLEEGRIVESGTHSELLKHKGAYHTYWTHQSDGFI